MRLPACSGCSLTCYCDAACQAADWREGGRGRGPHKAVCRKPIVFRPDDLVRVHSVAEKELQHLNGTAMEVCGDPDPAVAPSPQKLWLVRSVGTAEARSLKAACLTRVMFAEERPPNTLTTAIPFPK